VHVLISPVDLSIRMKQEFHCPRCKSEDIIEYDESFDCPHCRLEFDKKDCEELEDDQILSVQEKLSFMKELKE